MRLIDADKFCEYVDMYCNDNIAVLWKELIRRQPTAYDADKVADELDNLVPFRTTAGVFVSKECAKKIIRGGMVDG